jgi:hypothetical protein
MAMPASTASSEMTLMGRILAAGCDTHRRATPGEGGQGPN